MSYEELEQPRDSMQESFQPPLPTLEGGGIPMHNSMSMKVLIGKKYDPMNHFYFSNLACSLTTGVQTTFHDGCFPKAPNIFLIFSHDEIDCAASGRGTTYQL